MAETTTRNLRAYYYSFSPTGVDEIDAILEAVARAGKAYHNTSQWGDDYDGEPSYIAIIQDAAIEAARALQPLPEPPGDAP